RFFLKDAAARKGRTLSDRRLSAERFRMALIAAIALAGLLPLAPQPAAPFPRIITDAATLTEVAPGVGYGEYEMFTADGPLAVHVLAIDLSEPTVRLGAMLAQDRLISQGEVISSM